MRALRSLVYIVNSCLTCADACLRTCLVVTMGLSSQPHAAQAAVADAILVAHATVHFDGVQERALQRVLQVTS
jgi:hypothetical protein